MEATNARTVEVQRVEITDVTPLKILGDVRWVGKAKFPKRLRPRSIVIFHIDDRLVAIPQQCPHEHASLAEGRFVEPYVLECPLHQNRYDLRTGEINVFEVEADGDSMYLLWARGSNEPMRPTFGAVADLRERKSSEQVETLQRELAMLREAGEKQRQQQVQILTQMEAMIREAEESRNAIAASNKELAAVNEFVERVLSTMREVLMVVDTKGAIREVNGKAAKVLGRARDALRGRAMVELFEGEALAAFQGALSGKLEDTEVRLGAADGEAGEYLLHTAPLLGPRGKREGTVIVGTDVGVLKQAQRETALAYEKVSNLLDSMRQAVFVVVASGEIIGPVSRFSAELFDGDIVGRNVFDVLFKDLDRSGEEFRVLETAFVSVFDAGELQWDLMCDNFPRRVEYRRSEHTQDRAVLRVDYCPLHDANGVTDRLMLIIDDITKVEMLEALRRNHERRTQVLEELAANRPDELREFFRTAYSQLATARSLLSNLAGDGRTAYFRTLHTLKGNARMFQLSQLSQATHGAENASAVLREDGAGAEAVALGKERARDELRVVERQLEDYCEVAERLLLVPNDHEREIVGRTHRAMSRLDVSMRAVASDRGAAREAASAVCDMGEEASTEALRSAAGALRDTLVYETAGPDSVAAVYEALVPHALRRVLESTEGPPTRLGLTSWSGLYRATFEVTRAVLGRTGRSREQTIEQAISESVSLDHQYAASLLDELALSRTVASDQEVLRELWIHLAIHSNLEGLATMRSAERQTLHVALGDPDGGLLPALGAGRVPMRALTSFLDDVSRSGTLPSAVFRLLSDLFGGGLEQEIGRWFNSPVEHPDLALAFRGLDPETSPAGVRAWLSRLGASTALVGRSDSLGFGYLKRLDLLRLTRTVTELARGNYRLLFEQQPTVKVTMGQIERLRSAVEELDEGRPEFHELRASIDGLFHVPVLPSLYKYDDMVKDIARKLGKDVHFRLAGDPHVSLPRDQLARVHDALVHLVRNSVDHGLEDPQTRSSCGKPGAGTIELMCTTEGGAIALRVRDDGRGIDPDAVRDKGVAKGIISADEAAAMSEQEATELIFRPHFSTAAAVTEISGRGMGMDIVRHNLGLIGAELTVRSEFGHSTEFAITLRPKQGS